MKQTDFNKDYYKIKFLKTNGPISVCKDMANRKKTFKF